MIATSVSQYVDCLWIEDEPMLLMNP